MVVWIAVALGSIVGAVVFYLRIRTHKKPKIDIAF